MKRKPQPRLDAEAARELLSQQHPEMDTTNREEDAALWWQIQRRISFALDDRSGDEAKDKYNHERSEELCDLHAKLISFPEDTHAQARREELLEEIVLEAHAELQQRKKWVAQGKLPTIHHNPAAHPGCKP